VRSTPQRRLFSSPLALALTPESNASQQPRPKVIFSGIQPTGIPHIGNYLGALKQWKRIQDTAEPDTKLIFSIVDLHALTAPRSHVLLTQ
jgi:tryptophanyl-tRNA synthetase